MPVTVQSLPTATFQSQEGHLSVEPGTAVTTVLELPILRPDQFEVRVFDDKGKVVDKATVNTIGFCTLHLLTHSHTDLNLSISVQIIL